MPINSEDIAGLTGANVIDQNGDKVGSVGQIYQDDASGQPAWVSVKSGLFGLRESFVPLAAAEVSGGNITVPYTKDFIKDAPRVDAENHLDDGQQATLFSYYGVERPATSSEPAALSGPAAGAPDRTAAFGSEETADDLHDGRTEGLPVEDEDERDGAAKSEYTTPGGGDADLADRGNDLGSGEVTPRAETEVDRPSGAEVAAHPAAAGTPSEGAGSSTAQAAAVGAEAAAGSGAAAESEAAAGSGTGERSRHDDPEADPVSGLTADDVAASGGDPDWAETHQAHYQQENPAAQADWAAEEMPEEPVSTEWSVPSTDPALEEPTKVARSGYSPDRPAAHSSAYEGHGGVDTPSGTTGPAAAAPTAAPTTEPGGGGIGALDPTVDEGAVYAADADAALSGGAGAASASGDPAVHDGDAGPFGTVQPATGDPVRDDAVTGAADQTGTGYPPAIDAETAAYEVPGAEAGDPITGVQPGAALAADVESPAHGATLPDDTDDTDADRRSGEHDSTSGGPDDADGDGEEFGAQGYRPDRDGTDMTDEERERLNRARGAL